MEISYKEFRFMTKDEICERIKKSSQLSTQIKKSKNSGEAEKLDIYWRKLKKYAIKRGVCPECGFELTWDFKIIQGGKIQGFVKCGQCGYKEDIND